MNRLDAGDRLPQDRFFIRGWRGWCLYWGCWILLGAALAVTRALHPAAYLSLATLGWLAIVVLHDGMKVLLGLFVAWYVPLERGRWRRSLAAHLAAATCVAIGFALINYLLARYFEILPARSFAAHLRMAPAQLYFYGVSVGLGYAFVYYRAHERHVRQALALEARLARTRLESLRSQLQPDFLLATLRTIGRLIRRDPGAADRMIAELGDLLRLSLRTRGEAVPLKEELELLEPYLEIEKIRSRDRFRVEWRIDPRTLDACVPPLILQPLVEDAIAHCRSARRGSPRLEISAARHADSLVLRVRHSAGSHARVEDHATAAADADLLLHLERAYGADVSLTHAHHAGKRATPRVTTLRVPFREAAAVQAGSAAAGAAPDGAAPGGAAPGGAARGVYGEPLEPRGLPANTGVHPPAGAAPAGVEDPLTRPAAWMLFFGWWTFCGLAYANQSYVTGAGAGGTGAWPPLLLNNLVEMYLRAAQCVAALALARHLPVGGEHWRTRVPIHAAAALLLLGGEYAVWMRLAPWIGTGDPATISARLLLRLPTSLGTYVALLGIGHAVEFYRRSWQREAGAVRLQAQLAAATTRMLKMQLHPHFIFNALNTVAAFVRTDVRAAERALALLRTLLRRSLERREVQEVALQEELELLEPYLEIEKIRYGDRLRVRWRIDPRTLDARVPHLILQPLVENAIKHGVARRTGPGWVEIGAARHDDRLELRVQDGGAGASAPAPRQRGTGVGLANTRARLEQLYGGRSRLDLRTAPDAGACVTVTLPFAKAPARRGSVSPVPGTKVTTTGKGAS